MPTPATATRPPLKLLPQILARDTAPDERPSTRRLEDGFVLARFLRESAAYLRDGRCGLHSLAC